MKNKVVTQPLEEVRRPKTTKRAKSTMGNINEWWIRIEAADHINPFFFPSKRWGIAPYTNTCRAVHIRTPLMFQIGHTKKKAATITHSHLMR